MSKITSTMSKYVTGAMTTLIMQKGEMTKMIYAEDIEAFLLAHNVKTFIPVNLTLSALIDARMVRFFTLDNGRRVYGYTKRALEKLQPYIESVNKGKFEATTGTVEFTEEETRQIKFERMKEQYLQAKNIDDVEEMTRLSEQLAGYAPYVPQAQ